MPTTNDDYTPIKDYAIIGDCQTAALVSSAGRIDWYCPGRFDSPAVFCRILDAAKGGYFQIEHANTSSRTRTYLRNTNILASLITADHSKMRITQFMPVESRTPGKKRKDVQTPGRILSLIENLAGEAEIRIRFKPTFNYAKSTGDFHKVPDGIVASWSDCHLTLFAANTEFNVNAKGVVEANRKMKEGERIWIILDYADKKQEVKTSFNDNVCNRWLESTLQYWQKWVERCTYNGPYHDEVIRSALTLKLLTYEPTGAIIAAPTTSLPEEIGGIRNWDYRFAWLRDSALILYSLMTIGYQNEATDFFGWLRLTQEQDPTAIPQIMYKIDGGGKIIETDLSHLEGYRKSKPVRIGNAAASQFQLDIFGEILTAAYLHFIHDEHKDSQASFDAKKANISEALWSTLERLVNDAADKWRQPDNGIWEIRDEPREFLYSRLMCWAALDRGLRLAKKFGLKASTTRWEHTREEIRRAILEKGFNQRAKAFTQFFGSESLDAGVLIIPRIGFLPATDPRVTSTIEQIQQKLSHNGFIYRYLNEDGLPGQEATFSLCTFWQVDALALSGNLDKAHDLFERTIHYTNDVGLMSEELDPKSGDFLGNFPQGFTHLALIGSAVNLRKAEIHGAEEHPENEAQRSSRAASAAREGHSSKRANSLHLPD